MAPAAVDPRAPTAGDRLLAYVPEGADLLLEVDLARLRGNAVVGATVAALVDGPVPPVGQGEGAGGPWPGLDGAAALAGAQAVVLAAYRVGTDDAATITIVESDARPSGALPLGARVWALADEGQTAALLAAAEGGASASADVELLRLRAEAMPARAEGAAVRLAARFGDAARASLADALDLDDPPPAISLWADVADDLALIAWLGAGEGRPAGDDARAAALLATARARLAATAELRALGLRPSIEAATIAREARGARGTIVIGPRRLARAMARWQAHREATTP